MELRAARATRVAHHWRCRRGATENPVGWRVCRACGAPRVRAFAWRRMSGTRPLAIGVGIVIAAILGVVVVQGWTAVVGGGTWIVPAILGWFVAVLGAAVILQRSR